MIKASADRNINTLIKKTYQQALQADGVTPLAVIGETHLSVSGARKQLTHDALVVEDLDVQVLAQTPFMITNDISLCPGKRRIPIQSSEVLVYNSDASADSRAHAVRRSQSFVLRSSSPASHPPPRDFLEFNVPPDLGPDCTLAIEARTDALSNQCTKVSQLCHQLRITDAGADKARIVNNTNEPRSIRHHKHICQVRLTTAIDTTFLSPELSPPAPVYQSDSKVHQPCFFNDAVTVDPDNILPTGVHEQFREVLRAHGDVFNPTIVGYNGAAGPVETTANIGPVHPPQWKSRVPQYSRDKMTELQQNLMSWSVAKSSAVSRILESQ